jgi:hypothetical protein
MPPADALGLNGDLEDVGTFLRLISKNSSDEIADFKLHN